PFSSPPCRGNRLPTRARHDRRKRHSQCRNRSKQWWRPAVEWELYTTVPGLSQMSDINARAASPGASAGRGGETDRVAETLGLGAGHDERDVGNLDAPQVRLLGSTKSLAELCDRVVVELAPARQLCPEFARRPEAPDGV